MAETSSLWRFFGSELRWWREKAGLTQERVGAEVGFSRGQIGMVENAQRRVPDGSTVAKLDALLTSDGALGRIWDDAIEERLTTRIADIQRFEAKAVLICEYHPVLIPGLLQTEAYMRGLFSAGILLADEAAIEAAVQLRTERQRIFHADEPPRYTVVLFESVLRGVVQSRAVMRDQLEHLGAMGGRRRVTIQVIPFAAAKHAAVAPLAILRSGGGTLVHAEAPLDMGLSTQDAVSVEAAEEQFDLLRSQGLPQEQSMAMIEARIEELGDEHER